MARKINVKLILELRAANLSRNTIAATRHISRHSVSDVWIVNTFLDNFFKGIFPIRYRGSISQ